MLEALDVTKATGSDKIPAQLIKKTASVIAPSLCKLFSKSLSTGSFPQNWKEANVVPVFKKGKAECTENYRPISLPSLAGIQSLGAKDRLYKVVRDCQHGIIRGKSCTSNLLEVLEHAGSLLDDGKQVDTIYMDMSKAFEGEPWLPAAKVVRVRIWRQPLAVV